MDLQTKLAAIQQRIKAAITEMRQIHTDAGEEALTEEKQARFDELKSNVDAGEKEARGLEDLIAIEERNNETINGDKPNEQPRTEVKDQPVYRGYWPLGQQMRDMVIANHEGAPMAARSEARSRLEQCANRAADKFVKGDKEHRAAGTGMVESIGADGGILLQNEVAVDLMTKGFNNSEVLSRCQNRTLSGNNTSATIIGIDETSRATGSRGGGVRIYTKAELAQMTSSKTKFAEIKIEPKKLTGLYYASDEILEDVAFLEQEMTQLFTEEFAFKGQDLVINGSGVGEPLGIYNAPALVSQAKESGQTADTIVFENISKMWARMWSAGKPNAVWLVNTDCNPQLDQLHLAVGTGGVPVYMPAAGVADSPWGRLKGRPVVEIEQCQTVGDKGDIYLVDFSQYITANKGGMNSAMSIHLKFDYNQTTFRFTYRFDGQPRWNSALTPYKGSATVSPLIALAARA